MIHERLYGLRSSWKGGYLDKLNKIIVDGFEGHNDLISLNLTAVRTHCLLLSSVSTSVL